MTNPQANSIWTDYPVSPATSLGLETGIDGYGDSVFETFAIGDIVVSQNGNAYKVSAFTYNNTVLVTNHAGDFDPASIGAEFESTGLTHPKAQALTGHVSGLVLFS